MKLLFVCTHNRCRSILAEAICNHVTDDRIEAFSAGSSPAGIVHPLAIKHLEQRSILTDGLKSQSWDDYSDADIDAVVTLCDSAAGESCPLWMGNASKVHWGLPDPSAIVASDQEISAAFAAVMSTLESRILALMSAPIETTANGMKTLLTNIAAEHPAPTL